MYDYTKLVDEEIFAKLLRPIPTPKQKRLGRKRAKQKALLSGILQVLVNGVAWNNIAECGASPTSCWRYFHELQRRGEFKLIKEKLAKEKTEVTECALDTTDDRDFIEEHLQNTAGRRKRVLNLDKGYTSADWRRKLRQKGIWVNMETKKGDYIRKKGPKFAFNKEKYHTRFLVERLIGWLKSFRRIRIRREYRIAMFKAFVYLALIIILLR